MPRLVTGIGRVGLGGEMTAGSFCNVGKNNLERMRNINSNGSQYVLYL